MPSQVLQKELNASAFGVRKLFSAAMLTFTLLAKPAAASSASSMTAPPISVNGSRVTVDGLERNNSVFVPVRGFFEKLGAKVTHTGSSFIATRQGKELARMTVGNRNATVNGPAQILPVAPFMAGGAVMLPLRVISQAAGASVAYAASPRSVNVTRAAGATGAVAAGAAVAGAGAATVAQAAAPVASMAPVTDTQTNQSGIPWWVWALLALLVLALIFWAVTRRKKDPVIVTSSTVRANEPTIGTTGKGHSSEPTITARK